MSVPLLPNVPLSVYDPPPECISARRANSDYTAADFQHMLLAAQVYNTNVILPYDWAADVPSLHCPAPINYWMNSQTPQAGRTFGA